MTAIKAHFDGRVFVPDEPVALRPGEKVVVQAKTEPLPDRARTSDTSYLRKLDIHVDPELLRAIVEDPEFSIENS
jgi:hypothetical protein